MINLIISIFYLLIYRLCAFIVHKAEDKFYVHVFHCDPNAGPLCKTIEAACKVSKQVKVSDSDKVSSRSQKLSDLIGTLYYFYNENSQVIRKMILPSQYSKGCSFSTSS